jgi:hypothetical protein
MKGRVELEPELVWQKDGHLADPAIVALADEQDVLPDGARAHLQGCDDCTTRVGQAALVSLAVGDAMLQGAATEKSSHSLPRVAVAAALFVAALGAAPAVVDASRALPRVLAILTRLVPVMARGALSVARGSSLKGALVVSLVSLMLALVAWTAVLRLMPVSKQGVIQ